MVVISHRHKFVFIKTSKTAGTSIECSLSPLLPQGDVLSPFGSPETGHVPRNYDIDGQQAFYNHMSAKEVMARLGERAKDYAFWCVERHPVDKCISHFAMLLNSPRHRKGSPLSWDEYVARADFPIDTNKYSIKKAFGFRQVLVGKMFDYRHISAEIGSYLRDNYGISDFALTTRAKGSFRANPNVPKIQDISKKDRRTIMKTFSESIRIARQFGICYD